MINFIEKETYYGEYGMAGNANFTPIYFKVGDREHFLRNKINNNEEISLQELKKDLERNDCKFVRFYGAEKSPISFLEYVKKNKYTLQIHGELFLKSKTFTDFHGNLKEISSAFMFRIYDEQFLDELKRICKGTKKYYHYKSRKQ